MEFTTLDPVAKLLGRHSEARESEAWMLEAERQAERAKHFAHLRGMLAFDGCAPISVSIGRRFGNSDAEMGKVQFGVDCYAYHDPLDAILHARAEVAGMNINDIPRLLMFVHRMLDDRS